MVFAAKKNVKTLQDCLDQCVAQKGDKCWYVNYFNTAEPQKTCILLGRQDEYELYRHYHYKPYHPGAAFALRVEQGDHLANVERILGFNNGEWWPILNATGDQRIWAASQTVVQDDSR